MFEPAHGRAVRGWLGGTSDIAHIGRSACLVRVPLRVSAATVGGIVRHGEDDHPKVRPVAHRPVEGTRRLPVVVGIAVAVAAVVAGVVLVSDPGSVAVVSSTTTTHDGLSASTTQAPSTTGSATTVLTSAFTTVVPVDPLFGDAMPWVLLFDDGLNGVLAIDPNNRIAARSVIDGQQGGDPPYRLDLAGGHLVVGSGEIYATPLTTGGSVSLGEATVFVPSAEPDKVWLIDYPTGSVSSVGGPPTVSEAFVSNGAMVRGPVEVNVDGFPAVGVRGGLAIETETGVAIWDAATGQVKNRFGTEVGFVSDSSPHIPTLLAWCQDRCTELHITDVDTGVDLVVATHPDEDTQFDARSARFSNDLRFLAAPAGADVVIVDLETAESWVGLTIPDSDPLVYVAWAPSGPDLYASTYAYGQPTMTIAYHRALTGETEIADLPFGGALSFVVVDQHQGARYLTDPTQATPDCPLPTATTGRTDLCAFRY